MPGQYYEIVTLAGVFSVLVGMWANRYHANAFRRHKRRLRAAETHTAETDELVRFYGDRRVDIAQKLLILEVIGPFLLFVGVGLLLA